MSPGQPFRDNRRTNSDEFDRCRFLAARSNGDERFENMQKALIIIGIVIVAIGVLWPWLGKIPLGRLPGDIFINRPGVKVYIPITTMVVISVLISFILWIFRK